MGINKKSRTAKVIAGFVSFATAVTMSFGTASAATTEELQAQIASLLATIQGLQAQMQTGGTTTTGAGYTFATNLKLGSTGTDVMNLQKILNMDSATQIAATGAGSPGNESTYFGGLTKAAVIKYQEKYSADILAPLGLTSGTGFVGASMRAYLNSHYGSTGTTPITPTTPVGTGFGVMLSSDTPASGTLIAGQAIADLAHFTFSNPTGAEVKVTNLAFNRTGVSNDATLVNVYLYKGSARVTDAGSVSVGKITFNDPTGLFTIPAGSMVTISLKADILTGTAGQTVGVAVTGVTAGTTVVGGTFPITGNVHSIATATMASVAFTATPTPSGAGTPELQTGYVMWQTNVTVTTRAVYAKSVTFRQIGSAAASDLSSFQLFLDGTQLGTTVASPDANGYVTFDMSAAPIKVETGSHTLKLVGDIIGGSTKTFSWSLQQAGDAAFTDSQLNVTVLAGVGAGSFTALTTGTQTINSTTGGSVTMTKDTTSPSGNVVNNASNASIAKYTLKAVGEPIKVEKVQVSIASTGTGTPTDYALRNGAVFANGVQVGNTLALRENSYTGTAYTEFTLGSSLIVYPGTPVTLEVRADIYNEGTAALAATDTLTASVVIPISGYKKMAALTYNTVAVTTAANQLTVAVGDLTGTKNASYANQTTVVPQTAYKIGSFTIATTDAEPFNLNTIDVTLTSSTSPITLDSGDITDLYIVYGSKTSSSKANPSLTAANTFSLSETLAPNTTMQVDVYANLNATLDSASENIIVKLDASGNTASSVVAKSITQATGQTISFATGSMSSTVISDSATAIRLLVGNTTPKIASYRFTSLNDTFKITDLAFQIETSQNGVANVAAGAIRNFVLKSSAIADKVVTLNGNVATSSGMLISVPANDSNGVVVDVYANLNDVGAYAATSSANVKVTLANFKALSSTGTTLESGNVTSTGAGNNQYVFKSIPKISLSTLPSSLLTAGTMTLSKFTVTADAAGPIGWKKVLFTISKSAAIDLGGTSTVKLYDSSGTEVPGTFATTSGSVAAGTEGMFADGATSGVLTFVATNEQQITTSETYSLKDSITGSATAGTYVSTSIANPSSYDNPEPYATVAGTFGVTSGVSFVWTDRSSNSHSETTPDWNNDYKVMSLPTDTQTLSGSGS